tara:strand:+ start:405 stop:581 length:177 start_codon:yes stop_codon:yes gene_type:complete
MNLNLNDLRKKAKKLNIQITAERDDTGWCYWLENTGYEDNNFCSDLQEVSEKLKAFDE